MTARLCLLPVLLGLFLALGSPTGQGASFQVSVDPEKKCSAIEVTGELQLGDDAQFLAAAAQAKSLAPVRRIYLNSGGGNFLASTIIWRLIRDIGTPVDTIVMPRQQCSSGCVLLLAIGENSHVSSDATVILHAARHSITKKVDRMATMAFGYYLVESGTSNAIVETLTGLRADQELRIVPSNAKKLGLESFTFFGSSDPPATMGCAWPGFVPGKS